MKVSSDGTYVRVGDEKWETRYENFAAIIIKAESEVGRTLNVHERIEIEELLGAFWPKRTLHFH